MGTSFGAPRKSSLVSELFQKRLLFTRLLPKLIEATKGLGYLCTINEVLRSPAAAAWNAQHGLGISNSLHIDGLAVDLNLFSADGTYITTNLGHADLGMYWKSQHPDCCWGGDFVKTDFNHYSITYQGRK